MGSATAFAREAASLVLGYGLTLFVLSSFFFLLSSFFFLSCRVVSCRVVSCRVVSRRPVSGRVVSSHVVSDGAVSCFRFFVLFLHFCFLHVKRIANE